MPKARVLLATKYASLEDFQNTVKIEYQDVTTDSFSGTVLLSYLDNGELITSKLTDGVTEGDITRAMKGSIWDKISLTLNAPYAVWNRIELSEIVLLARHYPTRFGEGDVAFYDIAEASMRNIVLKNGVFDNHRDSLEKGYINTFNHTTAQALITVLYNEKIADYIATLHERHSMPNLVSGLFSETQLKDTFDFPVDNYVDIINNELGQELGKFLVNKHKITKKTKWDVEFTTALLNDIQKYYASAFNIELKPFTSQNNLVVRFSSKINQIKDGECYFD